MSVECYHLAHVRHSIIHSPFTVHDDGVDDWRQVASSRRVISLRRSQHVLAAVRDLTIAPAAIMNHQQHELNGVLVHEQHVEGRPNDIHDNRNRAAPHRLDDDDDDDQPQPVHHTWLHQCCRQSHGGNDDRDDGDNEGDYDDPPSPSRRWCGCLPSPSPSPSTWRLRLDKMFVFADDTAAQRYYAARATFVVYTIPISYHAHLFSYRMMSSVYVCVVR